jgi:hypothetical protein
MSNAACLETLRAAIAAPGRSGPLLRRCVVAFAAMEDCPLGAMGLAPGRPDTLLVDAVIECAERGVQAACPLRGDTAAA